MAGAHVKWIARSLGLVFAAGCGELEHGEYVDERATAECQQMEQCALGYFEATYRDGEDCVDERADEIDDFDDALPNVCDYDGEEARRCVARLNAMGCEEYAEGAASAACDLVWVCND